MNTRFDTGQTGGKRIAYVRQIRAQDLPEDMRKLAGGAAVLYALHGENGQPLALAADRAQAFVYARLNEYAPVSVH